MACGTKSRQLSQLVLSEELYNTLSAVFVLKSVSFHVIEFVLVDEDSVYEKVFIISARTVKFDSTLFAVCVLKMFHCPILYILTLMKKMQFIEKSSLISIHF